MALLAARIALPPGPALPRLARAVTRGRRVFAAWWAREARQRRAAARRAHRRRGPAWSAPPRGHHRHAVCRDAAARRPRSPRTPPAATCTWRTRFTAREGRDCSSRTRWTRARPFTSRCRSSMASGSAASASLRMAIVVAVAFEDPNSASPRIGLALSRTMGHIFEQRLLPVSDENGIAVASADRGRGTPHRGRVGAAGGDRQRPGRARRQGGRAALTS